MQSLVSTQTNNADWVRQHRAAPVALQEPHEELQIHRPNRADVRELVGLHDKEDVLAQDRLGLDGFLHRHVVRQLADLVDAVLLQCLLDTGGADDCAGESISSVPTLFLFSKSAVNATE